MMQQMALMGNKKTNANSVLPHAPCQGKILFQSSYSGSLLVMGGKNGVVCQWDLFSLPEEYHSSLGSRGSICCTLEHDTKTGIIFEEVWFPKP